jgi:hypothetical protein
MSGASLRANTTGPELPAPLPRSSGAGSTAEESFHEEYLCSLATLSGSGRTRRVCPPLE